MNKFDEINKAIGNHSACNNFDKILQLIPPTILLQASAQDIASLICAIWDKQQEQFRKYCQQFI